MITDELEIEYWTRLFYSTMKQEKDAKGVSYSVWLKEENLFREGCAYHISRLTMPKNNVPYELNGVKYAAGEYAPNEFKPNKKNGWQGRQE